MRRKGEEEGVRELWKRTTFKEEVVSGDGEGGG